LVSPEKLHDRDQIDKLLRLNKINKGLKLWNIISKKMRSRIKPVKSTESYPKFPRQPLIQQPTTYSKFKCL